MYSSYEKLILDTMYGGNICEETKKQLIEGFQAAYKILKWIEEESR